MPVPFNVMPTRPGDGALILSDAEIATGGFPQGTVIVSSTTSSIVIADDAGAGSPGGIATYATQVELLAATEPPAGTMAYAIDTENYWGRTASGWDQLDIAAGAGSTNLSYTASPTNGVVVSDTGTDATLTLAGGTNAGLMSPADFTKLAGVQAGSTANSSDATLLARANHTGTQAVGTITGLGSLATLSTVSTADISDSQVTYAKVQDVTAAKIVGRGSALGDGVAEELSATGGLEVNNLNIQIATSGVTTPKIANSAVLLTKIQNAVGANKLLGSVDAGNPYDEVSVGTGLDLTAGVLTSTSSGATNLSYTPAPTNGVVASDTGTDATLTLADGTNSGLMTPADFTKLAGVATGATANSSDATLLARANHTGTQTLSTISDAGTLASLSSVSTANIGANQVTYGKLQQASAGKLLGRNTSGAGDVEEMGAADGLQIVGTNVTIADGGITNAKMDIGSVTNTNIVTMAASKLTGQVSVAAGGTGLTGGTSGGVPYYSGAATIASSAALTAAELVLGGGPAAAPVSLALGASNQVLGVDNAGTAHEYKTIAAGSGITVTPTANTLTIAATATTTFDGLTDTPANKTGASLQYVRVNSGETALEYDALGALAQLATVSATEIASDAVTTAKILNSNVTFAKLEDLTASKLLGRGDSGTGAPQSVTIGSGLTMTGTTLSASGGGGSPGGADTQLQYNSGGSAFGGISTLTYNGSVLQSSGLFDMTQQARFVQTTLTDGATINWDLNANQVCVVTLAGNRTLAAPTNQRAGAMYTLLVKQDGTGTRTLNFNAAYKFKRNTTPVLATSGSDFDVIQFVSDGTSMYCLTETASTGDGLSFTIVSHSGPTNNAQLSNGNRTVGCTASDWTNIVYIDQTFPALKIVEMKLTTGTINPTYFLTGVGRKNLHASIDTFDEYHTGANNYLGWIRGYTSANQFQYRYNNTTAEPTYSSGTIPNPIPNNDVIAFGYRDLDPNFEFNIFRVQANTIVARGVTLVAKSLYAGDPLQFHFVAEEVGYAWTINNTFSSTTYPDSFTLFSV